MEEWCWLSYKGLDWFLLITYVNSEELIWQVSSLSTMVANTQLVITLMITITFCDNMYVKFISKSLMSSMQNDFCFPIIGLVFKDEQKFNCESWRMEHKITAHNTPWLTSELLWNYKFNCVLLEKIPAITTFSLYLLKELPT